MTLKANLPPPLFFLSPLPYTYFRLVTEACISSRTFSAFPESNTLVVSVSICVSEAWHLGSIGIKSKARGPRGPRGRPMFELNHINLCPCLAFPPSNRNRHRLHCR